MQYEEYAVRVALREDLDEGRVWINEPRLNSRAVIRISKRNWKKNVYCEALHIDAFYEKIYNDPDRCCDPIPPAGNVITMANWYRERLGITNVPSKQELGITVPGSLRGKLYGFIASLYHPQVTVRISTWSGVIGLLVGLVGLVVGILPFIK